MWALRSMLAADNGVSRRLWSLEAAWLAAAPFSKVTPFFSLKAMKSVVGWLVAQCARRAP
jgi:hypothetical protein